MSEPLITIGKLDRVINLTSLLLDIVLLPKASTCELSGAAIDKPEMPYLDDEIKRSFCRYDR